MFAVPTGRGEESPHLKSLPTPCSRLCPCPPDARDSRLALPGLLLELVRVDLRLPHVGHGLLRRRAQLLQERLQLVHHVSQTGRVLTQALGAKRAGAVIIWRCVASSKVHSIFARIILHETDGHTILAGAVVTLNAPRRFAVMFSAILRHAMPSGILRRNSALSFRFIFFFLFCEGALFCVTLKFQDRE